MRAADLVRRIWGAPPLATSATSATPAPSMSQLSQVSQGGKQWKVPPAVATVATVARGQATQKPPASEASIDPRLADLLREHGGYPSVRWDELALIDDERSSLWVVRRPIDGRLTVLVTTEPISKPRSYPAAWPARFTSREPSADAVPAAEAAARAVQRARQSCWGCAHLSTRGGPGCAKGHTVAWQRRLTRTYPRRADRLDCADQDGRES
jgi:hypothetical protein